MPEIMAGGAAFFDMDGDGFLDLYFVQGGSLTAPETKRRGALLYRNRGDGRFEDVTAGSGTDVDGYGMGVTAGDFDNDGRTDLYITGVGRNYLLRNAGSGRFTDVSRAAGVTGSGWSSSAAFVDVDANGWLDLFVARYVAWTPDEKPCTGREPGSLDYCHPLTLPPTKSILYRNNADGTFTDISRTSGIDNAAGNGLGVVAGDFTGDGRVDVFVANDSTPNHLWVNDGRGRFTEQGLTLGCAIDSDGRAKAGMGVDAPDIDGDGKLDLFVANLVEESDSLFRNGGSGFRDDTQAVGLKAASRSFTRFGTGFHDFDNDSYLDLFVATGAVARRPHPLSDDAFAEPDLLFQGAPGPRYAEMMPQGGTVSALVATSRGTAFGDIDNDGGIDIVIVNRDAPPYLLRNTTRRGRALQLRIVDEHGRDGIGAEVTIAAGGRTIRRDVRAAYSYLSSSDPRVHVGLRDLAGADSVTVRWPDGIRESFGAAASGGVLTLRRSRGSPTP